MRIHLASEASAGHCKDRSPHTTGDARVPTKDEPTKDDLRAEWKAFAPAWIQRIRNRKDDSREYLLDEWMLNTVGDVRGLDVIDIGCGEGRFSRMLAERGARVTAIDLCEPMIDAAKAARVKDEHYQVGDMEQLTGIADESFDLAVAYLSFVDSFDLAAAVRAAHRVLRPDGRLIACNLSPMVTAGNGWIRDPAGKKITYYLDNYFDESKRAMPMIGHVIHNFHRTFTTCINTFVKAGFELEEIREPYPSEKQIADCPANADNLRVPLFIIYTLRKG
jgi:ubiquinone/menaquinone biosynthesis C-methylase UbiE